MEICKGDPSDKKNVFQFASCHLNLPFSPNHDPYMARVMLLPEDGKLATQEVTFVNDTHLAGRTKEGTFDHTRDVCKQVKSRMSSLGN